MQRMSKVVPIMAWVAAGVSYYVHAGCTAQFAGRVVVLAVGPAGDYRSAVLAPEALDAITEILGAPDQTARTMTVESLLAEHPAH